MTEDDLKGVNIVIRTFADKVQGVLDILCDESLGSTTARRKARDELDSIMYEVPTLCIIKEES